MSGKPIPANSPERASTSLVDFSPSRLSMASKCGLAFKYKYVDQLDAPQDNARAMFGNAVHDGVQDWYGYGSKELGIGTYDFQDMDLAPIVLAQWERLLPPKVWEYVLKLRTQDQECDAVAAAILFQRPELKSPRTTVAFLKSEAAKEFAATRDEMNELCDALESVRWPQDEDAYKAYQKSAAIANNIQRRWQHLPPPIGVEVPFRITIGDFSVRGRIDQVRGDPHRESGELLYRMIDIKTGVQLMTQMEAFLQAFIYVEAIHQMPEMPDTTDIAFYMARHDKYQQGEVDRERHTRLASRILNGRGRQIIMGQFEPSYGMWCKSCDFADLCEQEIRLWSGDGVTLELIEA